MFKNWMSPNTIRLLVLSLLMVYLPMGAQSDKAPIVIGEYRTLFSKVLHEERRVWIHLPETYGFSDCSYPIILKCDALSVPLFAARIHDLNSHEIKSRTPESILISIENTDRQRDMYPCQYKSIEPGADMFLQFIELELIPFLEKQYRTSGYRILMGESNSGLFCIYTFLKRPDLFHGFIASSPELTHCQSVLTQLAKQNLLEKNYQNRALYIVHGERDNERVMNSVPLITGLLNEIRPVGLSWKSELIPQGSHVPAEGFKNGLLYIFKDYLPSEEIIARGKEVLKEYHEDYIRKMGFPLQPNSYAWYQYALGLIQQKKVDEGLECLSEMITNNPSDPFALNIYLAMARVYETQGQLSKAIECLQAAKVYQPAMVAFLNQKIAKLKLRNSAQRP